MKIINVKNKGENSMNKIPMAFLLGVTTLFYTSCSDDNATAATEIWVSNPASSGTEVYSTKVGNTTNGFECYIYESDNALVTLQTSYYLGNQETWTSRIELQDGSVVLTNYFEMTPSTTEIMSAMCKNIKESYKGDTVECESDYIKVFQTGNFSAATDIAKDKYKSYLISNCETSKEEFESDSSNSANSSSLDSASLSIDLTEIPQTCTGTQSGDTVILAVTFANWSYTSTDIINGGFDTSTEVYTGVTENDIEFFCNEAKKDDEATSVTCNGSSIITEGAADMTSAEMLSIITDIFCPAFLNGTMTLKDIFAED